MERGKREGEREKEKKKSKSWESAVRNKSDIFISTGVSSSVASATGPRPLLISTGRASFRPPQQFSLHQWTNDRPPERERLRLGEKKFRVLDFREPSPSRDEREIRTKSSPRSDVLLLLLLLLSFFLWNGGGKNVLFEREEEEKNVFQVVFFLRVEKNSRMSNFEYFYRKLITRLRARVLGCICIYA